MHHVKHLGDATISHQMFPQQPDVPGVIFNHQDAHGASSLPAVAPFFGNASQPEISGSI